MPVHISGIGAITTQPDNSFEGLRDPSYSTERYHRCYDPKWSDFFSPLVARRMSTIIRRALITTKISLGEASIEKPDAIITGTGLGCIEDTEKFLTSMIADNEAFMKPTYFIHSTHNTISSQVAINLKCHGYNNTYVHRGSSFEQALEDAMLLFLNKRIQSVVVGGHDEMTPSYFQLLDKVGYWKEYDCNPLALYQSNSEGSLAGEGSISFTLTSDRRASSIAVIDGMTTFYNSVVWKSDGDTLQDHAARGNSYDTYNSALEGKIRCFLESKGLTINDIDVYMTGINGDVADDSVYFNIANNLMKGTPLAWYKHLSLEYFTAPAFGLMAAARCLAKGVVPSSLIVNGDSDIPVKKVLLHNHFRNKTHSLILLSSCSD